MGLFDWLFNWNKKVEKEVEKVNSDCYSGFEKLEKEHMVLFMK